MKKLAIALLVCSTMGIAAPVFAASNTTPGGSLSTSTNSGGNHTDNANAGNGSMGQVGDNPNVTDPGYKCYRRDSIGETQIVCPSDMKTMTQ